MSVLRSVASKVIAAALSSFVLLAVSPANAQITAFKTGEMQTGMTKQCFYDGLGNQYTRTVSSISLCPLSIQVQSTPSYDYQTPQVGTGGVAFKTGEQVTGMTKQCYYNYLGSAISRTVSSVSLCPLTIPVSN
jgi:hypothetical protein